MSLLIYEVGVTKEKVNVCPKEAHGPSAVTSTKGPEWPQKDKQATKKRENPEGQKRAQMPYIWAVMSGSKGIPR